MTPPPTTSEASEPSLLSTSKVVHWAFPCWISLSLDSSVYLIFSVTQMFPLMQNSLVLRAHETDCSHSLSAEQHSDCSTSVELAPGMDFRSTLVKYDSSDSRPYWRPDWMPGSPSSKSHGFSRVRLGQSYSV
jgi:hypothetical protein